MNSPSCKDKLPRLDNEKKAPTHSQRSFWYCCTIDTRHMYSFSNVVEILSVTPRCIAMARRGGSDAAALKWEWLALKEYVQTPSHL